MAKQSGLTFEQVMSELRRKAFRPVYLLMGEEAYYIDQVTDYIQNNVLDESQREFDLTVVYGKDTELITIINAAKRYPMMSPYQVVIVKEAQSIKDWDSMQYYLDKPLNTTILVFAYKYGTVDKRKKWVQDISKNGVLFESEKLRDYEMGAWINNYAKTKNVTVDAKAIQMLTDFLGTNLSKMAHEVDKLLLTLPAGKTVISPEHVEINIGISKDFNVFELQDALIERNVLKANRIVRYFADNKKNNPMIMVLPQLFSLFSNLMIYHYLKDKNQASVASELKINPFFVKKYELAAKNYSPMKTMHVIAWIRETDARGKGVDSNGIGDGELMKELIFKIMH